VPCPNSCPIFRKKYMLNKVRSTICYKLSSVLGLLALFLVCLNLLLSGFIVRLELAAVFLLIVYLLGIIGYIIIFILLTICQFIEQKRIKQYSTHVVFDIGYILGLIFLFSAIALFVIVTLSK